MTVPDFLTLGRMDIYLKTPNTMKQDYCGSAVRMILFISSAPTHGERRHTIRKTFGNPEYLRSHGVRLLFSFARFVNPITEVIYFWLSSFILVKWKVLKFFHFIRSQSTQKVRRTVTSSNPILLTTIRTNHLGNCLCTIG